MSESVHQVSRKPASLSFSSGGFTFRPCRQHSAYWENTFSAWRGCWCWYQIERQCEQSLIHGQLQYPKLMSTGTCVGMTVPPRTSHADTKCTGQFFLLKLLYVPFSSSLFSFGW